MVARAGRGLAGRGQALDAGTPGGEQAQVTLLAPGGELPQVQGVSLTGQAGIAGQEPGQRQPLLGAQYRLGDSDRGGRGRGSGGHRVPPEPG